MRGRQYPDAPHLRRRLSRHLRDERGWPTEVVSWLMGWADAPQVSDKQKAILMQWDDDFDFRRRVADTLLDETNGESRPRGGEERAGVTNFIRLIDDLANLILH